MKKGVFFINLFTFQFIESKIAGLLLHKLREVRVRNLKKVKHIPSVQVIDSNLKQQFQTNTLQNLLQMHSNVFVRNYGVTGLSTISIRGSSAAQTQVLWNGINMNNSLTGISDFSAIPVGLFDEISVNYSNASDPNQDNSVSISTLKPEFKNKKTLNVALGTESIGNANLMFGGLVANKHFHMQTKLYIQTGKNNFPYYNYEREIKEHLKHANSTQIGLLQDVAFSLNKKNHVIINFWMQNVVREIPPALFEIESAKKEKILSLRASSHWKHIIDSTKEINTIASALLENYSYQDTTINLNSFKESVNFPINISFKKKINKQQQIVLLANSTLSKILNQSDADLQKASMSIQYKIDKLANRVNLSAQVQKEISNIFSIPMAGKLSTRVEIIPQLKIYGNISKSNRLPTLNELYYIPGGNINLKPETAKSFETGLLLDRNHEHLQLSGEFAYFNRVVDNWIAWYGNSILTPRNIQKVYSRGFEIISNLRISLDKSEKLKSKFLKSNLLYAYTLSTTKESALVNDFSIGKQIPYVPRYQLKTSIGFQLKHFEIDFYQSYTGYRFVTNDESQYLLPFSSYGIYSSYRINYKSNTLIVNCKINNILNTSYESIVGRIMPGRNFTVGIQYKMFE